MPKKAKVVNISNLEALHRPQFGDYEFSRRAVIPPEEVSRCRVCVYEIPPHKAAFPYHYHVMNEEVFYILSGRGKLTTPEGSKLVSTGDFLLFPADESGAHILFNESDTEPLVYIDFDTHNDLDVSFYPNTGKIGVWGQGTNKLFRISDNVEYYEGEKENKENEENNLG